MTSENDVSTNALTLVNCVKGGIGNQLFQHVFAKSLANQLHASLVTDFAFFGADPYGNKPALQAFDEQLQIGRASELAVQGMYLLREGGIRSLSDIIQLPQEAHVLVLDGYWQSEALLDSGVVRDTYLSLCRGQVDVMAQPIAQSISAAPHAVAVHVRRRDYGHMGLCEDNYYLGALAALNQRYPDMQIFAFTDEPNYVRHMLSQQHANVTLVSTGNDVSDLFLMTLCRHFVISNSTYSWWAARFAEFRGGRIICPKEWVAVADFASPCPPRWLSVEGAVRMPIVDGMQIRRVMQQLALAMD